MLGVEKGIVIFAILAASFSAGEVLAEEERTEPDPTPQLDLPARPDFAEAKQLLAKKKWAEAAIVLRTLTKGNPDYLPAAMDLARALVYSGRREEALGVLTQAVTKQKGTKKTALIRRTNVLSRIFLTEKTFQNYQEGLNLLTHGKASAAREKFEKSLEQEPDNVEILTRIGQSLVLDGDYDSAAERLRVARRLNPHEPEIRLWLGRALHQRGELTEAIEELRLAHQSLETSERAPIWYAEVLLSSAQRKAAIQVLEQDGKENPFHVSGLVALAKMRIQLFRDGNESLWSARKDLQVAMSRLPQYSSGEIQPFESDLGVELRSAANSLKSEIGTLISQLDGRLQAGKLNQ